MGSVMLIFLSFFIILLSSCSNQPIIMQENVEPRQSEPSIDLIDQVPKGQKKDTIRILEFRLENQLITLNVDRIPILSNYLAKHADLDQAIEEMQLIPVMPEQHDAVFLLAFARNNETYSYLLINTEKVESKLLADQANLMKMEPSPDFEKVIFLFNRNFIDSPRHVNKLIIYDIETWDELILTVNNEDRMSLHAFRWPILNVDWLNNSEVLIELPNISQPTAPVIQEWFASDERPIEKLITSID